MLYSTISESENQLSIYTKHLSFSQKYLCSPLEISHIPWYNTHSYSNWRLL